MKCLLSKFHKPLVLHLNIAHFDKCHKCRMFLTTIARVECYSQVSQMSNKSYCHDDDTKETLKIPQTLDLEEGEWLTGVRNLLPPEKSSQTRVLKESAPL